jgi:hypothetical protein
VTAMWLPCFQSELWRQPGANFENGPGLTS